MAKNKCLVVEDSPTMRQLLLFALARIKDLEVLEAVDGVEALKKMADSKFDLFMVDINMPRIDGLKLIKHIHADEVAGNVPIVIVSEIKTKDDHRRASSLGVDAYITKPVHTSQIIDTVTALLKKRQ